MYMPYFDRILTRVINNDGVIHIDGMSSKPICEGRDMTDG